MSKETLSNFGRKGLLAGVMLATSVLPETHQVQTQTENTPPPHHYFLSEGKQEQINPSRNTKLHDLLDDNRSRMVLGAGIILTASLTAQAYLLSKRLDEEKWRKALRISGPLAATAATVSLMGDSFQEINAYAPTGLLLTSTIGIGTNNILSTLENFRDKKLVASGIAAGSTMIGTGITIFLAANDKLPF